jgi:hypothetical protein
VQIFSGNGWQTILPLDIAITDESRAVIHAQLDAAGHSFIDNYAAEGVKLDSTFDLPRIVALPGTLKMKGDDQSLWRMVQIVATPTNIPPGYLIGGCFHCRRSGNRVHRKTALPAAAGCQNTGNRVARPMPAVECLVPWPD